MAAFRVKKCWSTTSAYDRYVQVKVWYGWKTIAKCFSRTEANQIIEELLKYQRD